MLTNSTKDIQNNKKTSNPEEVEKYFPGFLAFIDSTEQQIPRPIDNRRKKDVLFRQEEKTYCKDINLWLTIVVLSFIKQIIRKEKDMIMIFIKKNHPVTPKQVVNVFDLGYLGVEKDFPEQLSSHYRIKRREIKSYHKKKKNTTKFILKRE